MTPAVNGIILIIIIISHVIKDTVLLCFLSTTGSDETATGWVDCAVLLKSSGATACGIVFSLGLF